MLVHVLLGSRSVETRIKIEGSVDGGRSEILYVIATYPDQYTTWTICSLAYLRHLR